MCGVVDRVFKDPCPARQPFFSFFFLGQKVEEKLGLDIIPVNGTFKITSGLLFLLPAD